jgi:hypothetical protein
MSAAVHTASTVRWVRSVLGSCLLVIVFWNAASSQPPIAYPGGNYVPPPGSKQVIKLPTEPGAVEVAFTDGSNLKLLLRDEKITLVTPHGKLLIPVADIQRIEFAWRVSDEDAKIIEAAVADLGSSEFRRREAASTTLLKLREKSYPALVRAGQQKDLEVVRRAQELVNRIAAAVPPDHLVVRKNDVVYTADSMIAGRIEGTSLKAHASQFGAVQVKLADMRGLRSQALEPPPPQPTAFGPPVPTGQLWMQGMEMQKMGKQGEVKMLPPMKAK